MYYFYFNQNVMEERLVKIARLLATASVISHVITSVVAVLTIYAHLVGRAITAAKVLFTCQVLLKLLKS